jgi:hypothetical protein
MSINSWPPHPDNADAQAFITAFGPATSGGYAYDLKYALNNKLGYTAAQGLKRDMDGLWQEYLTEIKGTSRTNLLAQENFTDFPWLAAAGMGGGETDANSMGLRDPWDRKVTPFGVATEMGDNDVGMVGEQGYTLSIPVNTERYVFSFFCKNTDVGVAADMTLSGDGVVASFVQHLPSDPENSAGFSTALATYSVNGWSRMWCSTSASSADFDSCVLSLSPAYNEDGGFSSEVTSVGRGVFGYAVLESTGVGGQATPTKYIPEGTTVMDKFHNPINNTTFTLD